MRAAVVQKSSLEVTARHQLNVTQQHPVPGNNIADDVVECMNRNVA